jgi:hypothetical protein
MSALGDSSEIVVLNLDSSDNPLTGDDRKSDKKRRTKRRAKSNGTEEIQLLNLPVEEVATTSLTLESPCPKRKSKVRKLSTAKQTLSHVDVPSSPLENPSLIYPLLEQLFRISSESTTNIDTQSKQYKGIKHRTRTFFVGQPTDQPPQLSQAATILIKKRLFISLESGLWDEYYKVLANPNPDKPRVWEQLFNRYISDSTFGPMFYDCLERKRTSHFIKLLEHFLECCDPIDTSPQTSAKNIQEFLYFLKTHSDDPYSILIGIPASLQTIRKCFNRVAPVTTEYTSSFDLAQYLVEVGTIRNNHELAKNVRVLAAKLRGAYHVEIGDILLVVFPNEDELLVQEAKTPEKNSSLQNLYQYSQTPIIKLNSESSVRAVFGRCNSKPSSDNLILVTLSLGEKPVWVPVTCVYLVQPEYKSWASSPSTYQNELGNVVINMQESIESIYNATITAYLIAQLQRLPNYVPFSKGFKTISFKDEANLLILQRELENLLVNQTPLEEQVLPELLKLHSEFRVLQPGNIFAFHRKSVWNFLHHSNQVKYFSKLITTILEVCVTGAST